MSPVSPIMHGPRRRRLEHLLCYLVLLSALRPGMLNYMSTQKLGLHLGLFGYLWGESCCCLYIVVELYNSSTTVLAGHMPRHVAVLRRCFLWSALFFSLCTHRDDILTHSSVIDGMTGVDTFSVANLRRPSGSSWATACRTRRSASTAVLAANGDHHAEDTSFSTVEDLQGVSCCWSYSHCRLRHPPTMGL